MERTVRVNSRENHSLTFYAHHLARLEVSHEQNLFACQLFWFVVCSDATEDSALGTAAVIDGKLQELLRFLYLLAFQHLAHTDIHFLENIKRNVLLHGLCLVVGSLVFLANALQAVELCLYGVIFNFLEKQRRLCQLMTRLQYLGASELLPIERFNVKHSAQFL